MDVQISMHMPDNPQKTESTVKRVKPRHGCVFFVVSTLDTSAPLAPSDCVCRHKNGGRNLRWARLQNDSATVIWARPCR